MWWVRNPDEDYERNWAPKIEELGKKNKCPFDDWFEGEERVYFPFDPEHILDFSEDDEEIVEILEDAGYEVHDYKRGYCRRPGSQSIQRIGKVLNNLKRKDLRELKEKYNQGKIHNLRREIAKTEKYYDKLFAHFSSSPFRQATEIAKFYVVISQNPHDIARMSTGRNWESCMTLGSGSMHRSIFKEVQNGGLIAYLIRSNDMEIDDPIARIHIRRFVGKSVSSRPLASNISIAKSEDSVYGEDVPGFKEAVDEWIEEHQGQVPKGIYELKGGDYSDTYKSGVTHIGGSWELPPVTNTDALIKVYQGIGLDDVPYKKWVVTLHEWLAWRVGDGEDDGETEYTFFNEQDADEFIYSHELNQWDDWRHDEDEGAISSGEEPYWTAKNEDEEYIHEPLTKEEKLVDDRPKLQAKAAAKIINAPKGLYPIEIIIDIKENYPGLLEALRLKYPEIFTAKELENLSKYDLIKFVKALPPEERTPYIEQANIQFEELVNNPAGFLPPCLVCGLPINPEIDAVVTCEVRPIMVHHAHCPDVCQIMQEADARRYGDDSKKHSYYEWAYNHGLNDILDTYQEFRTRPFVRQSRQIPEPLIQKLVTLPERTYYLGHPAIRLKARIAHLLSMTGSDTPTVQSFYESLLPYWKYEFEPQTEKERRRPHLLRVDRIIYIDTLGSEIARLGENGRRFIPFLQDRLARLKHDFGPQIFNPNIPTPPEGFTPTRETSYSYSAQQAWEHVLRVTEKYLYILDSIESGKGHSTKYTFRY